jgi:hypothetical protein
MLLNSGPHMGVGAHVAGGVVGLVLAPVLRRWERVPAHASSNAPHVAAGRRWGLDISSGIAAAAMLTAIGIALLRGRAWQLDETPVLEHVQVADTPFSLDLPALVANDIHAKPSDTLRAFSFGTPGASPVTWSFIVYEAYFATTRDAYLAQMLESEQQAIRAGWKPLSPVALVTLGTRQAIRAERRHTDGREMVSYEMLVGHNRALLSAYREGPRVWGDTEERVAASLGMFHD